MQLWRTTTGGLPRNRSRPSTRPRPATPLSADLSPRWRPDTMKSMRSLSVNAPPPGASRMPERRLRFPIIATWFDMKKNPLLNIALSQLIASLGHGDMIVIGGAGLPPPPGVALIGLALTRCIPGFIDTLQAVMTEMQIDSHVLADELPAHSPVLAAKIYAMELPEPRRVPHEKFKLLSQNARAIIRTGECTPYANII